MFPQKLFGLECGLFVFFFEYLGCLLFYTISIRELSIIRRGETFCSDKSQLKAKVFPNKIKFCASCARPIELFRLQTRFSRPNARCWSLCAELCWHFWQTRCNRLFIFLLICIRRRAAKPRDFFVESKQTSSLSLKQIFSFRLIHTLSFQVRGLFDEPSVKPVNFGLGAIADATQTFHRSRNSARISCVALGCGQISV